MGSREHRAAAIGGTVAAFAALAILLLLVLGDSDDGSAPPTAEAPRAIDVSSPAPATEASTRPEQPEPAVVATVEVGAFPTAITFGRGAAWLIAEERIVRIDPKTNEVVARIRAGEPVGGERPCGITVAVSGVWVTTSSGAVSQISPKRNRLVGRPITGIEGSCLALVRGGVWVTSPERGLLVQLDPEEKTVRAEVPLEQTPEAIAVGVGSVWVASGDRTAGTGTVARPAPATGELQATVALTAPPVQLVAGSQGIWVSDRAGDLWRIDPATNRLEAEPLTSHERGIGDLALGGGPLWLSTPEGAGFRGSVLAFDTETGEQIGRPITVGEGPLGIAFGAGSLWVANSGEETISRIEP